MSATAWDVPDPEDAPDWDLCAHGQPLAGFCPDCHGVAPQTGPGPEGRADAGVRVSMATRLVGHAREAYRLGWAADGSGPFAVRNGTHLALALRGGRGSLRAQLARDAHELFGQAPSATALADALTTLEGYCEAVAASSVHLRVAHHQSAVWLDLGDSTGRAVRVAADGWTVADRCPVIFRRSELTGALPEPERGGSLDELWRFANVRAEVRPVVAAWCVAVLLPDRPCPIVALTGEQGTGKTTATRLLGQLLDPSPAGTRKPPKDVEAWVTAAAGSRVVAIDNLSGIPDWFSDSLCRAVTGDADVRRQLYTDGGLAVFAFRRAVVVNGIDLGAVRPDLGDRLVPIALDRITEANRIGEEAMPALWAAAWPRILGAVLDLAAAVLHDLATHPRPATLPRMADFGRILAAVDRITGSDAAEVFDRLGDDLAGETVSLDPVLAALVAEVREPFTGTATELLDRLDRHRPTPVPRDWPRSARGIAGHLIRHAPALRRLGWTAERDLDAHRKAGSWRLVPPAGVAGVGGDSAGVGGGCEPQPPQPKPANLSTKPAQQPDSAGVAGVEPLPPLLFRTGVVEGPTPNRKAGETTPATPATPATSQAPPTTCAICAQPLLLVRPGRTTCARCDRANAAIPTPKEASA